MRNTAYLVPILSVNIFLQIKDKKMANIAIEALFQSQIQEISLTGEEIPREPSSRAKTLQKNARIIDFSKRKCDLSMLDGFRTAEKSVEGDSVESKSMAMDEPSAMVEKVPEPETRPGPQELGPPQNAKKITPAGASSATKTKDNWKDTKDHLYKAFQELAVLTDVLSISLESNRNNKPKNLESMPRLLGLNEIFPPTEGIVPEIDPPGAMTSSAKLLLSTSSQVLKTQKSLQAASVCLGEAAKQIKLKSVSNNSNSSSTSSGSSNYHSDLSKMKQYWKLRKLASNKKTPGTDKNDAFIVGDLSMIRTNMNTQFEVLNTKSFENIDIRIPGLLKKPVALNFNLSEPYNSKNTCSLSSFDNEEENFDNLDNFAGDWSPYTTRDDIFTNNYDEDDSVSTASYLTMRGVAAKVLMTEIKDFDLTNPSQKEQAGSQVHVGSKNRNQSSKSGVGTGTADENNANTSSQMNDRDSSQNNPNGQNTSQNQDHYSNAVTFVPNWQKQLCQAQYALFTRQIYTFLNNKNSIKKQISAPIYSSSSGLIVSITNGNSLSVKMKDYSEIKQKRGRPPIKIHDNYAIRVFAGRLALEYFKKLNHIEKAIPSTAILGISNEQRQKTLSPISIAGLETYNRTENRSGLSKIISLSRMILIMKRIEEAISSVTP